eukprot:2525257-Alexandrium_andersonii.AAC.1
MRSVGCPKTRARTDPAEAARRAGGLPRTEGLLASTERRGSAASPPQVARAIARPPFDLAEELFARELLSFAQ